MLKITQLGNLKIFKFGIIEISPIKLGGIIMLKKYFRILMKKMKKYDSKATNPFINSTSSYNPFRELRELKEQTCIWVEKKED